MTATDLATLRRIAERAQSRNPGPWRIAWTNKRVDQAPGDCIDNVCDARGIEVIIADHGFHPPRGVTAQHIAACSPDVVIGLLDEIEWLTRQHDDLAQRSANWLLEEISTLRSDAAKPLALDMALEADAIASHHAERGNRTTIRLLRAALVEACDIADAHIMLPIPASDVVTYSTMLVNVDSGAPYRTKARIAELRAKATQ